MINFIIYEDEVKFRDIYFSIIDKYFNKNKIAYNIIEIDRYDESAIEKVNKLSHNKIFIIDIEVPGKSGLDLAKEIRNKYNDWESQIIIVTTHDNLKDYDMLSDMLALAFISKFYDFQKVLLEKIKKAYHILTSCDLIEFKSRGQLNQVRLKDILYIEKEPDEYTCTIVTKEEHLATNMMLIEAEDKLKPHPEFIKINRQTIININNALAYNISEDYIDFGDKEYVEKISRSKKKILMEAIKEKKI